MVDKELEALYGIIMLKSGEVLKNNLKVSIQQTYEASKLTISNYSIRL